MDAAVSIELFVEILNQYVYYFDQENEAVSRSSPSPLILYFLSGLWSATDIYPQVTTKYINGLIELIHSNAATSDPTPALENPKKHFMRTLEYISGRGYEGVITEAANADAKA